MTRSLFAGSLAVAAGALLWGGIPTEARAEAQLAAIFGDNMVLQRDKPVNVWGTAAPGETVSLSLDQEPPIAATAGPDGKWKTELPPHEAGGKYVTADSQGIKPLVNDAGDAGPQQAFEITAVP